MSSADGEPVEAGVKDGVAWRIGTDADVTWITTQTVPATSLSSSDTRADPKTDVPTVDASARHAGRPVSSTR